MLFRSSYAAPLPDWLQACDRGIAALPGGSRGLDEALGIRPVRSTRGRFEMQPETGTHAMLREWARLMRAGLAGRKAFADS